MTQTDLTPLTSPDQNVRLSNQMDDLLKLVIALQPLLDLLQKPATPDELGLIERLFELLQETKEELRLSREASIQWTEALRAISAVLAAQTRKTDEMHALLHTPLTD